MTLLITHKDQGFVAVSTVTKEIDGTITSPDSDPLCEVFRKDPTTGLLAKDLSMGILGEFTLSLVPGSSFLYSGPLDLSPAAFTDYEITISYAYGAGAGTNVERVSLLVSLPGTIIFRNRVVSSWSQGTTFSAPTPVL